jgi:predicted nucleotide-binding protein (sugar kinase/HSP70/actin superfamily)
MLSTGSSDTDPSRASGLLVSTRGDASAIARRALAEERRRLERLAGLDARPRHFRRPAERPFTAAERGRVVVLIGGLTWKHEILIKAVLERCGHRCDILPTPDVRAYQLGKDYGNNAQCNPSYFCVGSLLQYLHRLEASGLSRAEIIARYVLFTAGTCGPCRFGMYESEYRLALRNAGFDGFRVLTFSQSDGVRADTGEPGLRLTVDLGLGAMAAFLAGDVLNDLAHRLRPYEGHPGETDRVLRRAVHRLADRFRERPAFELARVLPRRLARRVDMHARAYRVFNTIGKVVSHLYGRCTRAAYAACRDELAGVELDYTRVKPVVKVVGEFWAQTTEGDGNFRMFEFLEQEGAHVLVEPIGGWVAYLLHQRRATVAARRAIDAPYDRPAWWALHRRLVNAARFAGRSAPLWLGEAFWARQYTRVASALGGVTPPLVPQAILARLAHPYYHHLARGGEGHLEVGKSVYYTQTRACHMVVSLKPFGCLPSTQSDGVHAAVVSRYPQMIFVPIETSGEGQASAYSRVQMALAEAAAAARDEFDRALAATGLRLEDIRAFVAAHPVLRSPFYPIPKRPDLTGVAANFVTHVADVARGRARLAEVRGPAGAGGRERA